MSMSKPDNNPGESMKQKQSIFVHLLYAATFLIAVFIFIGYKESKIDQVNSCLAGARKSYEENWAQACKTTAKIEKEGYAKCMKDQSMSASDCVKIWEPKRDATANCSLPIKNADHIDTQLDRDNNLCMRYAS